MRVRFYSHNRGNAIMTLRGAVDSAIGSEIQGSPLILRSEGSRFRPRAGDLIINYGSSNCPISKPADNSFKVLNDSANVAIATNKRNFFRTLATYNEQNPNAVVPLPSWTEDRATAQEWVENGFPVYARQTLQGHSGEGISVHTPEENSDVVRAPLYTKGITGARREYRIHVFNGEVILVQKKQRRSGWRENPNYSDTVRNLDGGWVFGISTANPSDQVRTAAVNAIAACGLDFGAVDVLAKGQQGRETEVYVLEVNTAPGQGGDTTTERYVSAISAVVRGQSAFSPYGETTPVQMTARVEEAVSASEPEPVREVPIMEREELVAETQVQDTPVVPTASVTGVATSQTNIPTSLEDCEEEGYYFADVTGYREPMIVQHDSNGVFHISGEEVPVTVTALRSGLITLN